MQITGIISKALPARQGVSQSTGNPWMSQDFLLDYQDGTITRKMMFSVFGEDKLRGWALREGDMVTVSLDITAREGQGGRWFHDIKAWRVDKQQGQAQAQVQQAPQQVQPAQQPPFQFPPTQNLQAQAPQAPTQNDLPF